MRISLPEIGDAAFNLLDLLDREGIVSVEWENSVEKMSGSIYQLNNRDCVAFRPRISKSRSSFRFPTIAYTRPGVGKIIGINIRTSYDSPSSRISLIADAEIQGYSHIGFDSFENRRYLKEIFSSDFSLTRKELGNIAEYRDLVGVSK